MWKRGGSGGFGFEKTEGEELLECRKEDAGEKVWIGWIFYEWAHGHLQLFWVTDKPSRELPAFFHRVQVLREML